MLLQSCSIPPTRPARWGQGGRAQRGGICGRIQCPCDWHSRLLLTNVDLPLTTTRAAQCSYSIETHHTSSPAQPRPASRRSGGRAGDKRRKLSQQKSKGAPERQCHWSLVSWRRLVETAANYCPAFSNVSMGKTVAIFLSATRYVQAETDQQRRDCRLGPDPIPSMAAVDDKA
jgi:hypothetical protein